MILAVTIDVEEEGLFSTRYDSRRVPTENVSCLTKLDHIFTEHEIRPTLFVSYQAARRASHRDLLIGLQEKWHGEIGAHLHHWNTPPIEDLPYAQPVPSELMPRRLLKAKIETLFEAIAEMNVEPVSFRMGRFNLGPKIFNLLEHTSILVDSSIAPMRKEYGGPAGIRAPVDPYFPDPENPRTQGGSKILEVPVTILPVVRGVDCGLERLAANPRLPESAVLWVAKYLASISIQPMALGLRRLKAGARFHRNRGGRVLTMYFHSSELMAGGCPQHRTEGDVDRFLKKLDKFLGWLRNELPGESRVMSEVREIYLNEHAGTDTSSR